MCCEHCPIMPWVLLCAVGTAAPHVVCCVQLHVCAVGTASYIVCCVLTTTCFVSRALLLHIFYAVYCHMLLLWVLPFCAKLHCCFIYCIYVLLHFLCHGQCCFILLYYMLCTAACFMPWTLPLVVSHAQCYFLLSYTVYCCMCCAMGAVTLYQGHYCFIILYTMYCHMFCAVCTAACFVPCTPLLHTLYTVYCWTFYTMGTAASYVYCTSN